MRYDRVLYSPPAIEPVTLQQAKAHLRLEADSFEDNVTSTQSIAPGSHAVAAAYSLKGVGVDVSAAGEVVAVLEAGQNGIGGTVAAKLQESDTDVDGDYKDVTDGVFDQVTEANDNATYKLTYEGGKKYVRVVATVAGAACSFGISILCKAPIDDEDSQITRYITIARRFCERLLNRAFITQTWDLYARDFPAEDEMVLPLPPLQSVTSVKYKDSAGVLQTWAASNYIVDTVREPGRISLKSLVSWPTVYDEIQAVQVRFVCGYGNTAASVPNEVVQGILVKIAGLYEHRGDEAVDPKLDEQVFNVIKSAGRIRNV